MHRFCNYLAKTYSIINPVAFNCKNIILKADTGASKHFASNRYRDFLQNLKPTYDSFPAILPNNSRITSSHVGNLPLSKEISPQGSSTLVYPKITNESLLSIGQLFDDDCLAFFSKKHVLITKNDKLIFKGYWNVHDRLWDVPLSSKKRK